MDHLDHWRLVRVLTVKDAAQLVIGQDPRKYSTGDSRPIAAAIIEAIELGEIKGELIHPALEGIGNIESSVNAESLKAWLKTKGIESHFFFPETAPASTSGSEEQAAELENYRRTASEVSHLRSRLSQAEQNSEFLQAWKDQRGPELEQLRKRIAELEAQTKQQAQHIAELEAQTKQQAQHIAELEAEAERTTGTGGLMFPYATPELLAMQEAALKHWAGYNAETDKPPQQKAIGIELTEALGLTMDSGGGPSRQAAPLATAIRPEKYRD